jgi:hypothetical protein
MGTFTEVKSMGMRHIADNRDLQRVTEDEIDGQIISLFKDKPIKFIARKGNKLDDSIQRLIDDNQFTIPVHHIENSLYLIGSKRL